MFYTGDLDDFHFILMVLMFIWHGMAWQAFINMIEYTDIVWPFIY